MSAFEYFKSKGHRQLAPIYRSISNAVVASTITLVTPVGRIALTNLSIQANTAGTIAFYFGQSANQHEYKLAEFTSSGSAMIIPYIKAWESTAVAAPILVRVSVGPTNGWAVNAEGFDLDSTG